MRSTLLFLALLVFVSCSTEMIDSYDSVLMEMSADPRSEAVFATMAIQLKQTGGFDRVLALLNQLVDDGRKQLRVATKLWRKTEARCDVSTMKFAERQNFYENREAVLKQIITEMTEEKNYANSSVDAMKGYAEWFVGFNKRNTIRQGESAAVLNKRYNAAKAAVDATDKAMKTVSTWSGKKKASLIQADLEEVTAAFLELKNFNLVIPDTFVELAASNGKVRQRLLEWLGQLRVTFLEMKQHFEEKSAARNKIFTSLITSVKHLISVYTRDVSLYKHEVAGYNSHILSAKEASVLYVKLSARNSKLVAANADYCKVEKVNYSNTKNLIEGQLDLFEKIRGYFRNNYHKITKFIRSKYNRSG